MPRVRSIFRFLLVTFAAVLASAATAQTYSFRHATVIDGLGGAPAPDRTVIVDAGRIVAIAPTGPTDGSRGITIDATGKYLLPGLMDVHIHLSGPLRDRTGPIAERRRRADEALASYLYLGFTTVADLGNAPELILDERQRERAGTLLSPHILAVGNLLTSINGKSSAIGIQIRAYPADRAKLERHLSEQHPDFAKLVYDEQGWATQPLSSIWDLDTLKSIIGFYHRHGLRTVVHIASELRAREAIAAGIDALAHPVTTGEESQGFVDLMAQRKIPFETTLTIRDNFGRLAEHPEFLDRDDYKAAFSPAERETLKHSIRDLYRGRDGVMTRWSMAMLPVIEENVRRIVAAGGIAALGTDQQSGPAAHREMQLLIQAGLSPLQVITAATHNAAIWLGIANRTGSIEVGKDADLLLVNADPLRDIDNLESIALVMKSGRIVDESRLPLAGGPRPRRYP